MEDFSSYSKKTQQNAPNNNSNLTNLISSLANKYDGASEKEIMSAIIKEAEKGKRLGTLSNADIDKFATMLAPMLDDKKRNYLNKIVKELKKI